MLLFLITPKNYLAKLLASVKNKVINIFISANSALIVDVNDATVLLPVVTERKIDFILARTAAYYPIYLLTFSLSQIYT